MQNSDLPLAQRFDVTSQPEARETARQWLTQQWTRHGSLAVHVVLVSLAGLLVATLWWALFEEIDASKVRVEDEARRQTTNVARVLGEHAEHTLGGIDKTLLLLKFQYEKVGTVNGADSVRSAATVADVITRTAVINENGAVVQSSPEAAKAADLSDREYFRAHVERDSQEFHLSAPLAGHAHGKPTLHLSRRLNKADGSFGGVAVASIDPDYFARVYGALDLGKGGTVALVGRDGIVRASRDDDAALGHQIGDADVFRRMRQSHAGTLAARSPFDTREKSYAFQWLPDAPLAILVGQDTETVYRAFDNVRSRYLAFGGAMTVLIALLAAISSIHVMRQRTDMARLREAQARAESAHRVKSEFLASISHQLRTPLNGIVGYAEFLRDNPKDETGRDFADIIFRSSLTLLGLFDAMLDMIRLDNRIVRLQLTNARIDDITREACELHRPEAQRKQIEIVRVIAPEADVGIQCDRTRVTQVLNNLLHNAVKFTRQGQVKLSVSATTTSYVFDVEDRGAEIDLAERDAIFERFRHADPFAVRSQGGIGLGLTIARELARLMGGDLTLLAASPNGSTFRFVMPKNGPKAK